MNTNEQPTDNHDHSSLRVFVLINQVTTGPFSLSELDKLMSRGEVTGDELARLEHFSRWMPLNRILSELRRGASPNAIEQLQDSHSTKSSPVLPSHSPVKNFKRWAYIALIALGVCCFVWDKIEKRKARQLDESRPELALDNLVDASEVIVTFLGERFPSNSELISYGREFVKKSPSLATEYQLRMRTMGYDISEDESLYAIGLLGLELEIVSARLDSYHKSPRPALETMVNNFVKTGYSPVTSLIQSGLSRIAGSDKSVPQKFEYVEFLETRMSRYNSILKEKASNAFYKVSKVSRDAQ